MFGNIALWTGVTVFDSGSLPSACASDTTQVAGAGFEANTDTIVMSYICNELCEERTASAESTDGSTTVVSGSHTHWLDTGSTWFCFTGSSYFSPVVRWEIIHFPAPAAAAASCKMFQLVKSWFFILNTLSPVSKHHTVGGGTVTFVSSPPPLTIFVKVGFLVSLRGYYLFWVLFC